VPTDDVEPDCVTRMRDVLPDQADADQALSAPLPTRAVTSQYVPMSCA
jgi:hypothetical protein